MKMKWIGNVLSKTISAVGWAIGIPLVLIGAFATVVNLKQLKAVDIVPANPVTKTEQEIDIVALNNQKAINYEASRFKNMRRFEENNTLYLAYASQFDTLNLSSIAAKAFAVDSVVDAQIKSESNFKLYGEERGGTPLAAIIRGSGGKQNISLLKEALLEYLEVPLKKRFVCVVDTVVPAKNEDIVVMVDTASTGTPESLVFLENDGKPGLTSVAAKNYAYHIAIGSETIRYITPAPKDSVP